MGCHTIGIVRYCPDEPLLCLSRNKVKSNFNNFHRVSCNVASKTLGARFHNLIGVHQIMSEKYSPLQSMWRTYSTPVGLEEQSSSGTSGFHDDETVSADPAKERLAKPRSSNELKSLLADSERSKLVKKLSEANQHNRFLKRQVQEREDALVNFKSELAVLELEIQALVTLADEIAKAGIPEGSRKINGRYIHSHLAARLEAVQQKFQDQIKDVAAAQSKEVPVFWIGMAESVQIMGSFDGWSQGEHLSPEYTGSYTKFSTNLLLRPGRYEIKFLVDGEWKISSEFPTIGEGLQENNLLVVE
ncbi:protein PTST, chloroplastic-like isoform X2 [Chenopodium quinoa]|uniref:AMP-activated protein kinase glycogen-binding domain-containing protein n=1 Tax=Chenopodium quinoa TaxID=63459 RepID=A0A803N155_CHEQI|nr:protein PTST, chloroplastic-like isoform X2 [Chenopodium quinoa]